MRLQYKKWKWFSVQEVILFPFHWSHIFNILLFQQSTSVPVIPASMVERVSVYQVTLNVIVHRVGKEKIVELVRILRMLSFKVWLLLLCIFLNGCVFTVANHLGRRLRKHNLIQFNEFKRSCPWVVIGIFPTILFIVVVGFFQGTLVVVVTMFDGSGKRTR